MSILGYGPKEKQPKSWYDSFMRRFGTSNPDDQKWYSKFNFVKNTKDKVVQKLIMFFGGLFFIYIFAKAIPSSIRRYSLQKQELELENKKLEIEKLKIELEERKLARQNKKEQ